VTPPPLPGPPARLLPAATAVLLVRLDRGSPRRSGSLAVPIAVFLWTWLGSTLAHAAFLHLPSSAGYGFLGLGTLGIPLLTGMIRGGTGRHLPPRPACHGTM
jgi:putative membrane protein